MALNIVLLVLASICIAHSTELVTQCPPKESTACSCFSYPDSMRGLYVDCGNVNSLKVLRDGLEALMGYKIYTLTVVGVNTSTLSDLFQGLHVQGLQLFSVRVDEESIGHSHFLGLENSLEGLDIYLDGHSLSSLNLDHLYSLKDIYVSSLGTREFRNGWFKGPKSLETFYAPEGKLEKLGDKIFASFENLYLLTLSWNQLKEISRSMLPYPANHLEVLNLEHNEISKLPNDIFSGMPVLNQILIGHNLIHVLPENIWSPVFNKLITEYARTFEGNPLQCDEDMKWVCDMDIRRLGHATCASPNDKKGLFVKAFCKARQFF